MRVGQRLFLAVIPAVIGILAVAALYYWGQFARVVPEWVVAIAIVAATLSLVISWMNTRYIATRIDRLAARVGETRAADVRAPRARLRRPSPRLRRRSPTSSLRARRTADRLTKSTRSNRRSSG